MAFVAGPNATEVTQLLVKTAVEAIRTAVESKVYTWPAGSVFRDRRTLTADGTGGDLEVKYRPAAGGSLLPLGGTAVNSDSVSRNVSVDIRSVAGANRYVAWAIGDALGAGSTHTWPRVGTGGGIQQLHPAATVEDGDELRVAVAAVTALQPCTFSTMLRYLGGTPTVTEVIG